MKVNDRLTKLFFCAIRRKTRNFMSGGTRTARTTRHSVDTSRRAVLVPPDT
jgi:hypothetical protein